MPQEALSCGPPTTMVQNRVYALPAVTVWLVSNAALQFSQQAGTGFTADVTASTTGMQSSWAFCRSTNSDAIVTVRRHQ